MVEHKPPPFFNKSYMAKNKEPDVRQPNIEQQREYASLRDNSATTVHIRKKRYRLKWAKNGQISKLSKLLINGKTSEENPSTEEILSDINTSSKLACKAAAVYILDGYWRLKFRYWFLWRWFYYIRQYDDEDLREVLEVGKKKVPLQQFCVTIMSLTEAKDTLMMMRTREAERILRELSMEQPSQQQKKDNG